MRRIYTTKSNHAVQGIIVYATIQEEEAEEEAKEEAKEEEEEGQAHMMQSQK